MAAAAVDRTDISPSSLRGQTEQEASSNNDVPEDIEDMWRTWERCVIVRKHSVVKSERSTSELPRLPNGKVLYPWWAQERLRNEAATLKFITSIRVVACLKGLRRRN
ncbi:hypothetical protein QBC44DRAFT_374778 [Cladorrhinum sp. PSN332]|nr:hypothetical protein QBC44DRAFT_374778 [Cladorrhinum sp. PSN332]